MIPGTEDIVVTRWMARFQGRRLPCSIGRGGLTTDKREGDGATPVGAFALVGILYRPDRIAGADLSGALPIRRRDVWSDDPLDPAYNRRITGGHPYGWGHERLSRSDPLYDLVIVVGYNWPAPVPGRGSAIFIHQWRTPRHPTAGCIAFAKSDLLWIAARISSRTRLVVQGPA